MDKFDFEALMNRIDSLEKSIVPQSSGGILSHLKSWFENTVGRFSRRHIMYAAGLAYALWLNRRLGPKLGQLLRWILSKAVPGFRQARSWITGKVEARFEPTRLDGRENVMESIRDGSLLTPMMTPKCQVSVGQMRDGEFHIHGCGVRLETFLVLPDHVWSYSRISSETGRTWLMGAAEKPIEVSEFEANVLDTDMVYVRLPNNVWSQLGVGTSALVHEVPSQGVYCTIVGPATLGSCGMLRHDPYVFGRVVYDGSTTGGFSGAAYMRANSIAGIHQRGGKTCNGGFSVSYLWVTLCAMEKMKPEDTADWLRNSFKGKKRVRVDKSWADTDTVRVMVDGAFAIVERSSMKQAFGSNYQDDLEDFKVPRELGYEDAVNESGEVKSLKQPGALSVVQNTQEEETSPVLILTNGFKRLSTEQQNMVMGELNALRKITNIRKMALQSKAASSSIVTDSSSTQQA
ncbi:hypothetical protein 1 [Hubei sobemo-like virus 46]|uniref:hypothetical protein 1 n=1 Tax=Hubei sobemo-like virus 46 TaxID=1923234 RepID=UPI00090CA204|nr:hypothetical protein 1 [Hubei sobemo-like virus 46]APG75847.1 hypothetical protein 1 [Hubei sobemo-like virus 46]